ncbi:MAG: hypothetical protein ACE14T_12165 [Syntrophales bacterium]
MAVIDYTRFEIAKEAAQIAVSMRAANDDDTDKRCARITQIFYALITLATNPD